MDNSDTVMAVRRMQAFIEKSLDAEITLETLGKAAGYSPWYSSVIFKKLTGKSPFEYIRQLRLSKAALRLRDENVKIIDVALDCEFNSHEGFTRAFSKQFNIAPKAYADTLPPIKLFMPYPVNIMNREKGDRENMEKKLYPIFTSVVDRPQRKLIIRRGVKAACYCEYCAEAGCDVWGILTSVKEALCEPVGMWLPKNLRKPNTSEYCQGVEVPLDYNKPLPDGFETVVFPPCKMLVFQGPPFNDEDFGEAIEDMWEAIKDYKIETTGYRWAPDDAPRVQMEPQGKRGYIEALPVRLLERN